MNYFEIARRFAGLTGLQLAELLEVSPQQITNWGKGLRTPSRSNAVEIAGKLDVEPAWLLGVPDRLAVADPLEGGTVYSYPILRAEDIAGYGILYHVYNVETGDIVPVILGGGVQFTPTDWQTLGVRRASEIAEAAWMDARGADAVMVDGLPRTL